MSDIRLYLLHIVECIADVNQYIINGHEAFEESKLIQDAVIRKLQVIAQSTMNLPDDLKAAYSSVKWKDIRGFRNLVVHDYLEVDPDVVWSITQNDLPILKIAVETMLSSMDATDMPSK